MSDLAIALRRLRLKMAMTVANRKSVWLANELKVTEAYLSVMTSRSRDSQWDQIAAIIGVNSDWLKFGRLDEAPIWWSHRIEPAFLNNMVEIKAES